jgi:hypothetical protein
VERERYLAANPGCERRWAAYEQLILDKYGKSREQFHSHRHQAALDEAWIERDRAHQYRASKSKK